MKHYYKDITSWVLIILFLIALFFIYNQQTSDQYIDLDKNVPAPDQLDPVVAEKVDVLLKKTKQQNINAVITDKVRSMRRQNKLYKQGRSTGGNIVTYAEGGESYHNYGLAVDYALRNEDGEVIWDIKYDGNHNGKSDWFEVAEIAKGLGFDWGGDWKNFKDYPHLQMDFGLSIQQLQNGMRPAHKNNHRH